MELASIDLALPRDTRAEPPLYRSRYGGLWIDRRDAHDVLQARLDRGEVTASEAEDLAYYIDHGYVTFPKATDESLVDEYVAFFESAWDRPPPTIYALWQRRMVHMSRDLYDEVAKISCLHCYFPRAGELIFPPKVLRFLELIFERPPVAFQTMSMRKGSQENLHIDTGPLTLTEPLSMAASWVALEDVQPHSGEFEFIPGSHALPELLHYGVNKGHNEDMREYGRILERTLEMCAERGLKTERFMAKKGDVLIWHADLMHGGARIEDPSRTRLSLVAHFMPLGVMPTFYDFSSVSALRYPNGGYCLDNLIHDTTGKRSHQGYNGTGTSPVTTTPGPSHSVDRLRALKDAIPLSVKRRVPAPVREYVSRWLNG
jgi:phytanoyl-CoA hydroxylase